tara:strand:+ start:2205 stop:2585 length:381 start_codon:yes stop_codon:yes gene_type:complete
MPNLVEAKKDRLDKNDLIKLAKDPQLDQDLEVISLLKQMYDEAVKNGFKGTLSEFTKSVPLSVLKRAKLNSGGLVDFSGMSADDLKVIFRSIMGRNPKDTKELIRVIRLDMKAMDDKGVPYGVFEK